MKKLILVIVVPLILLPVMTYAAPGYYIQGELGMVALSAGTHDMFNPIFNPAGGAGRLSVGHLWGDNNFNYGLETGLMYYPHADMDSFIFADTTTTYKGYNFDILGVIKYTFDSGFSLFGKAGGAYVHQNATSSLDISVDGISVSTSTSASGSRVAPEVALGVGYQLTSNLGLNLTADTVFAGTPSASNPVATTNSLLLGLAYRFA